MHRKNYVEASRIVGRAHKAHGPEVAGIVEAAFVALFITDNERFDPKKFMDACRKEATP
jgi:hypothetical protein